MSSTNASEDTLKEKVEAWLTSPDAKLWAWFYEFLAPLVTMNLDRFDTVIDSDELEDLCQVVVQKVLSRLHSFDPAKAKLKTWVKTVTHNTARDHLRKRRPVYVDAYEERPHHPRVNLLSPEDVMEMHGWIPWRIDRAALQRVADTFVKSKGKITRGVVVDISEALAAYDTDYHTWASATQVTHFLFALIRMVKARDADRERIKRSLRRYISTTPLGLVIKKCGVDVAIELLILFGGGEIALPDIASVVAFRT